MVPQMDREAPTPQQEDTSCNLQNTGYHSQPEAQRFPGGEHDARSTNSADASTSGQDTSTLSHATRCLYPAHRWGPFCGHWDGYPASSKGHRKKN